MNGKKVITYKGDRAVISSFDIKCNQLGHFIGKYQVSFDSPAVGWYTWEQLTLDT
tara:strand:+ start:5824 stop:5988 length:165 start_codon:yes stop_codon:yes gene_type:complete